MTRARITVRAPPFSAWARVRAAAKIPEESGFLAGAALAALRPIASPAPHCKKRRILSIRQQYPRPLDPACRFRPRMRYRPQLRRIRISERQLDRPPPRCHVLQPLVPKLLIHI